MRSHITPSWGTSYLRLTLRSSSIVLMYGLNPPCTQKILSLTTAAKARKSKTSVQYLQTLRVPNLRKHSS
jgi:hypothetical protein